VSVNQTGYFPQGTKIALVVSNSTQELDWSLKSSSGETLMSGKTSIKGEDKTSGDFLHAIDFSSFSTPGSGYRIAANELESVPFAIAGGIYSQLKSDAMAYFYHNRSGIPIEAKYAGDAWARPAGHLTDNNVTCYKGIDADGKTWPGCDYILNAAGGWYDAGDFGKYVVNGGISVWTLMNLYEQDTEAFPDGSLSIPENANGVPDLLDEARWEMEFLLSMQVPDGEPLAGMVHHKLHDESWAGMPMVPPSEVNNDNKHEITGTGRYLYPPSTAATLNLAATAAACARIWEQIDPAFAERCLSAAETAWEAARANPALLAGNTPGAGGGNYPDNDITDESSWAAAELFITTGKSEYETALLESPLFGKVEAFEWGRTASLATISLTTVQNNLAVDKHAGLRG
jgi:endoglucanase